MAQPVIETLPFTIWNDNGSFPGSEWNLSEANAPTSTMTYAAAAAKTGRFGIRCTLGGADVTFVFRRYTYVPDVGGSIYLGAWVTPTTYPAVAGQHVIRLGSDTPVKGHVALIDAGSGQMQGYYMDNAGSGSTFGSAVNMTEGTAYWVAMRITRGDGDGSVEWWLNGVSQASQGSLDNDADWGNDHHIWLGAFQDPKSGSVFDFDNIILHSNPVIIDPAHAPVPGPRSRLCGAGR